MFAKGKKVKVSLGQKGEIDGAIHTLSDATFESEGLYVVSSMIDNCPIMIFGVPEKSITEL